MLDSASSLPMELKHVTADTDSDLFYPSSSPEDSGNFDPLIEKNEIILDKRKKNDLGTIMGVYVPCILSIFGVVMFIRFPWVIGVAGLVPTLAMFVVSFLVVILTALSLSAISTNGDIKGGGAYYMISRALGPEFGGSIGVVFYLANAVGGATYLLGFVDSMIASIPEMRYLSENRWILIGMAIAALAFLTIISFLGASIFSKTYLVVFLSIWVAVFGGLAALAIQPPRPFYIDEGNSTEYIGSFTSWSIETVNGNLWPDSTPYTYPNGKTFSSSDLSPLIMFSILFPSVTGIMAGANMSGDLKNPGKSIPVGTLAAIFTSMVTYFTLVIFIAFTVDRQLLRNNYFVYQDVAWSQWIVVQGLWAATLSSALGNLLGASRILQAIARDELIPFLGFFKKGSAKGDEPQRAVLFSAVLMSFICFAGDLDSILPIVSMFYLLTYGITNFACFMLSITGAPNWRPLFRYFSKWASLLATILCVVSMFVLTPIHASVSMVLFLLLFGLIHLRAPATEWGDISQALIYHQVRKYLLRLQHNQHVKFWRPSILMFVDDLNDYLNVIDFGNNIKKGGLFVLGQILLGDASKSRQVAQEHLEVFQNYITQSHVKAFTEVTIAPSYRIGVNNLIMMSGIGGMRANSIMLKFWTELNMNPHSKKDGQSIGFDAIGKEEYLQILNDAHDFKKNILIARNFHRLNKNFIVGFAKDRARRMSIDVWVMHPPNAKSDFNKTVDIETNNTVLFVIQLGYILHCTDIWKKYTSLRILFLLRGETNPELVKQEETRLKQFLLKIRVVAKVKVVSMDEEVPKINFNLEEGVKRSKTRHCSIINSIMKKNSTRTAVSFIPFQLPAQEENVDEYIEDLDVLSEELPPCILVHAVDSVIATEL